MEIQITNIATGIPTQEDISSAENTLGIKLPDSYKDFVLKYGVGLLCDLFTIYVPNAVNTQLELVHMSQQDKNVIIENIEGNLWEYAEPTVDTDWLQTLTPFGTSINGDIVCWDANRKLENGEYPIVILSSEQEYAVKVATSMSEFIDFCLSGKIDELLPVGQGKKWKLPSTFVPANA
jgi:cell wall assembly regulator SMI1